MTFDPKLVERARQLLARMNVREKLGQMSQLSVGFTPIARCEQAARQGLAGSFINCDSLATRNRLQRIAVEESRLGIPLLGKPDLATAPEVASVLLATWVAVTVTPGITAPF